MALRMIPWGFFVPRWTNCPDFQAAAGEKSNDSMPINGKSWFIIVRLCDINFGIMVRMHDLTGYSGALIMLFRALLSY